MEALNMNTRHLSLVILAAAGLAACGDSKEHVRADSLATAKALRLPAAGSEHG